MKKVEIVDFEEKYFHSIKLKDTRTFGSMIVGGNEGRLRLLLTSGKGYVVKYEDVILGVIGYLEIWPGVCEIWAMPTHEIDKYPKAYAKSVRNFIEDTVEKVDHHRCQILTEDSDSSNRWVAFLGFTHEGTLRQFSDIKQNYNIWSRIK